VNQVVLPGSFEHASSSTADGDVNLVMSPKFLSGALFVKPSNLAKPDGLLCVPGAAAGQACLVVIGQKATRGASVAADDQRSNWASTCFPEYAFGEMVNSVKKSKKMTPRRDAIRAALSGVARLRLRLHVLLAAGTAGVLHGVDLNSSAGRGSISHDCVVAITSATLPTLLAGPAAGSNHAELLKEADQFVRDVFLQSSR
jgi:hypothetical protein